MGSKIRTKEFQEEQIDKYREKLYKRGCRCDEIKIKIEQFIKTYFSEEHMKKTEEMCNIDGSDFYKGNAIKSVKTQNILERRFNSRSFNRGYTKKYY